MTPRTPQQQEAVRTKSKKKILDAALFLFAQKGYFSTSVNDIAVKAKVSKGLMYNYYKSKEDLLDEILDEMLSVTINMRNLFKVTEDPKKILEMIIQKVEDEFKNNLSYWKLQTTLFLQPGIMEKYSEKLDKINSDTINEFNYLFERAGSKSPELDTGLFLSSLKGIQLFYLYKPDTIPLKETSKYLIEKIFNDINRNK